jgi:hypothetical protein
LFVLSPSSTLGASDKVVILPLSFESDISAITEPSRTTLEQAVIEGAGDAGMEICQGSCATSAAKAAGQGDTYQDRSCLARIAQEAQAGEALAVRVVERGELDYELILVFAQGGTVHRHAEDGFFVVAAELRRLVALGLTQGKATQQPALSEPARESRPTPDLELRPRPVNAQVFWAMLAGTGVSAMAFVATDLTGLTLFRRADSASELETLQLIDRMLLGTTAALSVATFVLAFFTDFHSGRADERNKSNIEIAPSPTGLVLQWRF